MTLTEITEKKLNKNNTIDLSLELITELFKKANKIAENMQIDAPAFYAFIEFDAKNFQKSYNANARTYVIYSTCDYFKTENCATFPAICKDYSELINLLVYNWKVNSIKMLKSDYNSLVEFTQDL